MDADQIWSEHRPAVVRHATLLLGGDTHLAEDVAQEAAVRLCRHRHVIDRPGSVAGWLRAVTHNIVVDLHRRRLARPATSGALPEEIDLPDPAPPLDLAVTSDLEVARLLGALGEPQQDVIRAIYVEGHTMRSAAAHLNLPIGTVKSRTHHALKILHRELSA